MTVPSPNGVEALAHRPSAQKRNHAEHDQQLRGLDQRERSEGAHPQQHGAHGGRARGQDCLVHLGQFDNRDVTLVQPDG
jgi:hypothetical protein